MNTKLIIDYMEREGLTIEQMAKRCNMPIATLRRVLDGDTSTLRLSGLIGLLDTLGLIILI